MKESSNNSKLITDLIEDINFSTIYFDSMRQIEILSTLGQITKRYQNKLNNSYKSKPVIDTNMIKKLLYIEDVIITESNIKSDLNIKEKISSIDRLKSNSTIDYINNLIDFVNHEKDMSIRERLYINKYISKKLVKLFVRLDVKELEEVISSLNEEFTSLLTIVLDTNLNYIKTLDIDNDLKLSIIREKYLKEIVSKKIHLERVIKVLKKYKDKDKKNTKLLIK